MKKLKQLAKEAYNSKEVCQEWKYKILEAYPEVKPKLEVGKWYKDTFYERKGDVYFITKINENGTCYGYGIKCVEWIEVTKEDGLHCLYNSIASKYLIPATEEEVSEALIQEAKKRGFNSKTICICLDDNTYPKKCGTTTIQYEYNYEDDYLFCGKQNIYEKGKWAEIIEQEPEEIKVTYEEVKPKVIELDGVKYRLTEIKNK